MGPPTGNTALLLLHKRELVGAKPLHLLAQTALPLKSLTGAFIAAQTRTFLNPFFTGKEHSSQDGAKLLISVKKI